MKKQIPVELILKLHDEEKLNPTQISKKLKLAKETVKNYLFKNNRTPYKKQEGRKEDVYKQFIETLKANPSASFTKLRKKLRICHKYATRLIQENNIALNKWSERQIPIEELQLRVPEGEGKIISKEKNGKFKLITDDGFVYYKDLTKLHQGDPRKMERETEEEIRKKLLAQGYEMKTFVDYVKNDTTYVNKRKQITAKCLTCGYHRECLFKAYFTNPCSGCVGHGTSFGEEQMVMWLESLGIEGGKYRFRRTKGTGGGKGQELDFLVAGKNIAIEYCGIYWHNEESRTPRDRSYHKNKMKLCNENGIKLITMFEDEWVERNSIVKSIIKSKLGIFDRRIYARKCTVKQIEHKEARLFIKSNHLQDGVKITAAFGLFFEDKLIGVMTASKHHRNNKAGEITLSRMAFEKGLQVIGGASKLFSAFIKWCKENNINKVISWSDNRWSEGDVYKSMNFELEADLPPEYDYVLDNKSFAKRFSKQSCTKKKLKAMGGVGNTESEMAKSLKFKKIWDCGKKRWVYKIP